MKIALIDDTYDQYDSYTSKYWKIGSNTGNILFKNALRTILDSESANYNKLSDYDTFVATQFIWIPENYEVSDLFNQILKMPGDKKIVAISVGLQAHTYKSDFHISDETLRVLKEIESRSVIAVRGNYTAEILNKKGITNIQVVGCPSVYQIPLYSDSLAPLLRETSAERTVSHYKSLYGRMSEHDRAFLKYISKHCIGFVEQTSGTLADTDFDDPEVSHWLTMNGHLFFDLESWLRYIKRFDFCMGARFHGNVAAVLIGMKGLLFASDSRTREMAEFFQFPHLPLESFNPEIKPQEYADQADFSSFVQGYSEKLSNFLSFLEKNELPIAGTYQERLKHFAMS
jgi:hypothetical protein